VRQGDDELRFLSKFKLDAFRRPLCTAAAEACWQASFELGGYTIGLPPWILCERPRDLTWKGITFIFCKINGFTSRVLVLFLKKERIRPIFLSHDDMTAAWSAERAKHPNMPADPEVSHSVLLDPLHSNWRFPLGSTA
jgi:hypothetical protein